MAAVMVISGVNELECRHVDRGDGVCSYCSLDISTRWEQTGRLMTGKARSIMPDLASVKSVPQHILNRANEKYQLLDQSTHRRDKRKSVVLLCLYEACQDFGHPVDPKQICREIGAKPTAVASLASLRQQLLMSRARDVALGKSVVSTETSSIRLESAVNLIPNVAAGLSFTPDNVESTVALANQLLETHPHLKQVNPVHMAAGLISYYLELRYGTTNMSLVSEGTSIPLASIEMAYEQIIDAESGVA